MSETTFEPAVPLKKGYLGRLRDLPAYEVIQVMARREAGRLLFWERSRQALVIGVLVGLLVPLLIPLHRTFGAASRPVPYLLLFCLGVQIALLVLSARAVWAGARHDAASGSLEEIILTGAPPQALLLGKWLGASVAGLLWAAMLAPGLLLAGAFTGAESGQLLGVLCGWAATPVVGALVGGLVAFSDRAALGGSGLWFVFQGWILLRLTAPKLASAFGPVLQELVYWVHQLDPITLVPAALGRVREPWGLKLVFLLLVLAAVLVWLAGAERELPETGQKQKKREQIEVLSLRPLRAWSTASLGPDAESYDRDVLFHFERRHGWRLRISPPAWLFLLAFTVLPAVPAAILGREGRFLAPILAGTDVVVAAGIAALGMAASLASEQEQGRWTFLLCTPRPAAEILLAKWRAVWLETSPLWGVAAGRSLVLAVGGSLEWSVLPVAVLAPPVIGAAAAGVVAALALNCASLAAAQQRALLWVLAPPLLALGAHFLLPRLPGLEWLSPAHGVASLAAGPGGTLLGLLPLAAHALLGAAGLAWAVRSLRRGERG